MNYTAGDIEKAKELKSTGKNWVARNENGELMAYTYKPEKRTYIWTDCVEWHLVIHQLFFQSVTWEDEEPTSIDLIIASEKPKYDRLTDRDLAVTLNTNYGEDMTRFYLYAQRLWELENKIESGELIFREGNNEQI